MVMDILVNIGSGNGLVPNGTKPLPEPMLACHEYGSVTFNWDKFYSKHSLYMTIHKVGLEMSLLKLQHYLSETNGLSH